MNKKNRLIPILIGCLIGWVLGITSCKEPLIQDKKLLNHNDTLGFGALFIDTFSCIANTVPELPAYSNGVNYGMLGSMNDPVFGKTFAGIYAQFGIKSNQLALGDGLVLDSCVLTLGFKTLDANTVYGAFTQPVSLIVYELNQNIYYLSNYYSKDIFPVKPTAIVQHPSFLPDYIDTLNIAGTSFSPHMRIRLSNAFGNKLLLAGATNFADNPSFLNYLNGLYLTTNTAYPGNGLVYVDLFSANTKVTLYYRNSVASSLSYDFPIIKSTDATVNHIDHNYSNASINTFLNNPTASGDSEVFIQASIGTKGKVYFPYMNNLPKNIIINKAEIVLTQEVDPTYMDTVYKPPVSMQIQRIDNYGIAQQIDDNATYPVTYLQTQTTNSGTYNRYHFIITQYFQRLLAGVYDNHGFYISASSPVTTASRVQIANRKSDPNYKITLKVIYSKLN